MNLEQTRFNMVAQQIRTWNVLDDNVLDLLYKIKREEFIPTENRAMAFVDMEIPLGYGQVMLTPKMEARIVQELHVKKTDKILEVGSGSGYLTALLADQGAHVYSVEIIPELKTFAENNLKAHEITNVTIELGDAARGWPKNEPYDVIVLTASTPALPDAFQESLNPGGRLFAIVGEDPVMEALLITCIAPGKFTTTRLFETSTPPLINALQPTRFTF
ncbi:MAG: protein-L-isoaspartate O-methyltransferase [Nitrosomonas sp.]|uniref:protein-L-isoaspartate O-methyltransferase family protein n=1 Tax=Nitrosomonas sp. TaxID=42353 RepID=UPI0027278867|nr:protein-L-isoaspartate O-methyltransferase [Nitrosomonas sp.]MDO8895465.1 protein-L-isoaspartate O-methyltransferase [Nitrosomonas sp.]MDO9471169.1 protein-L-isoaspartate O-methyltransferase [Nitrosomonas sp.]MDP1787940.1 protein-L-isoaspartate O-methyltransferase [Nitrosomonas sp.]MDP1934844.1 protein-L-isoaspartate O-methyltransferase [Nitrosomonas sp.]MDP2224564.1 protein-L-isoaspartate O-methyltransferase [Nitrosomonas sp.]